MSQTRQRARDQQHNGRQSKDRADKPAPPKAPELISLAISSVIVLGLVGVLAFLHVTKSDAPALLVAQPLIEQTHQAGELFYLPVEIANRGGQAGEEVTIRLAVVQPDGSRRVAELTVGFLAAGESTQATVAVPSDPRGGRVEIEAIGYLEPA